MTLLMTLSGVIGVALAIGLFLYLPSFFIQVDRRPAGQRQRLEFGGQCFPARRL